jgi:hypothetical protein
MPAPHPYPRRIPPQKMKLAMRIGRHYRVREIQLRHFAELAKACSYPEEHLFGLLRNLAEEPPDEASGLREVSRRVKWVALSLTRSWTSLVGNVGRRCAALQQSSDCQRPYRRSEIIAIIRDRL